MIFRDKKIILIHIPKTGGTSLKRAIQYSEHQRRFIKDSKLQKRLNKRLNKSRLRLDNFDTKLPGPQVLDHMSITEYLDYGWCTKEQYDAYEKVTIVRNPYDRFVSAFYYSNKYYKHDSYIDIINNIPENTDSFLYRIFAPCSFFIDGVVDTIYNTETLSASIKNRFPKANRIHSNKNKAKEVAPLTNEVINWINKFYIQDFKNFNYEMR